MNWRRSGIALGAVALVAGGLNGRYHLARSRTTQLSGTSVGLVDTSERVVALTFDDGSTAAVVDEVLSALASRHVEATFFVNSAHVAGAPQVARRLVAAWGFDLRISKDTQLRLFLNRAYFGGAGGREVIGFPAAASAFFGMPLGQLSDSEYSGLLAMLEAPSRYHVLLQPAVNAERIAGIQQKVQKGCGDGCFQGDAPVPCATTAARH